MDIYRHLDQLPQFQRSVVTIGTFDGVHTGHARILAQLREEAMRIDGETVIITFYPHPRKVVKGGAEEIRLINTLEEKIQLLSWQHIDHLVIVPFTEAFSQMTAEQYITDFLLARFHPHTVIIGYDHRFGKGRQGDYHLLEQFSGSEGFVLQEIPVHLLDEVSVSSTRIREAVRRADIDTANQLLGYPFFFSGRVVKGNQLGRTLGYPTANLEMENPEKLTPANGIYAVEAQLLPTAGLFSSPRLQGMMSIGTRPTIDGANRTIEVNLFDFDEDIYGRELRVFVRKWLRPELKFNGLEELKTAIAKDKIDTLAALNP
ncbi:MAG TPA: bifunctional riboflavin kinase/FAD synthetase [Puia sp.]|uniref:bifunctional riboflavin kinase/FAD synthetase n=1 Tax=Puia sp. TaxID=2045100 RepID=UPI002BD5A2BD|nr:bifunctional riboflavin kinase/FAD synthetase [Puia sp.]HVU95608.1 bifunctional riboflavin kinase/FAD synthetase [Puia sp.]